MDRPVKKENNQLPATPLTLDGSYILHQMFRIRWAAWHGVVASAQKHLLTRAATLFTAMEQNKQEAIGLFSMLGHKGDLMLVHFRKSLDALNDAELTVAQSELYEYLDPSASYLSVVELGLYGASLKLYSELTAKGVAPRTGEWNREVEAELSKQRDAAAPRLWPEIPQRRYLCFYPMNKFRGETKNWYSEPIHERPRMMREHGMIGRHYGGRVTQIISGSIGFDDWEWGVDLFATIRWCSKNWFTRCGSMRLARFTVNSALSSSAFAFGRTSLRLSLAAKRRISPSPDYSRNRKKLRQNVSREE